MTSRITPVPRPPFPQVMAMPLVNSFGVLGGIMGPLATGALMRMEVRRPALVEPRLGGSAAARTLALHFLFCCPAALQCVMNVPLPQAGILHLCSLLRERRSASVAHT